MYIVTAFLDNGDEFYNDFVTKKKAKKWIECVNEKGACDVEPNENGVYEVIPPHRIRRFEIKFIETLEKELSE
jgi:hypothetical protein